MRIGVDIDGVLNDLERFRSDFGAKFGIHYEKANMVHPELYPIEEAYEWDTAMKDLFWKTYLIDMVEQKPRRFAKEILRRLKMEGNEIYIITARNNEGFENTKNDGMMPKLVENWLTKHYIVFDKIVYTSEDKEQACKEQQIDILIEDAPFNVLTISNNIPVLCYDAIYNRHVKGERIFRVYSFYDVYQTLQKIQGEMGDGF